MKIEKNVPAPEKKGNCKYPWGEMEVGDSVLIKENIHSAKCAARSYGSYHGKKFICREREGGVRIWRSA